MENFFNRRYSIRLVWLITVVFIFFVIILAITFKFVLGWSYKDSFDYTSKISLTILALCTLLYHLHNLENQIKTQQKSNKQNLAKHTYDICSDFRRPMMMDINEDVRKLLVSLQTKNLSKGRIKKFEKFLNKEKNIKYRKSLVLTLNYFESISAMVLAGDLDNEIVQRLFGSLFGRYYILLQDYISYRQEESPKSWANYQKLVKKWKEETKH